MEKSHSGVCDTEDPSNVFNPAAPVWFPFRFLLVWFCWKPRNQGDMTWGGHLHREWCNVGSTFWFSDAPIGAAIRQWILHPCRVPNGTLPLVHSNLVCCMWIHAACINNVGTLCTDLGWAIKILKILFCSERWKQKREMVWHECYLLACKLSEHTWVTAAKLCNMINNLSTSVVILAHLSSCSSLLASSYLCSEKWACPHVEEEEKSLFTLRCHRKHDLLSNELHWLFKPISYIYLVKFALHSKSMYTSMHSFAEMFTVLFSIATCEH